MVHGETDTSSDDGNDRTGRWRAKGVGLAALDPASCGGNRSCLAENEGNGFAVWYSGTCSLYLFQSDRWIHNHACVTDFIYAQRHGGTHRGSSIGNGTLASLDLVLQVWLAAIFIRLAVGLYSGSGCGAGSSKFYFAEKPD